ncbi:caspase-8 [Diretmus argenteus]
MDTSKLFLISEDLESSEVAALCFLCSDVVSRKRLETVMDGTELFYRLEEKGLLENPFFLSQLLNTIDRADLVGRLETDSRRPENFGPQTDATPVLSAYRVMLYRIHDDMTKENLKNMKFLLDRQLSRGQLESCTEYYSLTHNPRGVCMIINNELFSGLDGLKNRPGTQEDEKALRSVFSRLGFDVKVHSNMTANGIRDELNNLGRQNFVEADALVVCVLSHGDMGYVYGTDEKKVSLRELTRPFTSRFAPTLAQKPKLFFIQACQGSSYQRGAMPFPPRLSEGEGDRQRSLEEDAGPVQGESVPWDADFLLGMATVGDCKSFRNVSTGSIYIQELCKQLENSAARQEDILTVLTRVNREVSKGEYMKYKQMPEPKYTLTKKLILNFV